MDGEKIFPSSKKIHVSASSSLVDLKAELFKRKAEASSLQNKCASVKNSTDNDGNCGSSSKKPKWQVMANQLEEKGELNKIRPTRKRTSDVEKNRTSADKVSLQDDLLRQSRESLEAKAKLYEERYNKAREGISSYNSSDSDSDTDDATLINFRQKVLFHKDDSSNKNNSRPASPVCAVPLDEDLLEDDDWIVFTDSLGRSRRCLKEDFQHFKQLDEKARRDLSTKNNSDSSSDEETRREDKKEQAEQKKWEEIRPAASVRYRQVIQDEVREHGVGFYMMSADDEERKKQLDMLDSFRQQTARQREMREKMKERRKQAVTERLTKVAQRKGIQLNAHSLDSVSADVKEQSDQLDDRARESIRTCTPLARDSLTLRDRKALAMKEIVARPWDEGKRDEGGRIVKLTAASHLKYLPFFRATSTDQHLLPESDALATSHSISSEHETQSDCVESTRQKNDSPITSCISSLPESHESDGNNCNNNEPTNRDNVTQAINEKLAFFRNQS